jgi:hypothetical protein
MPEQLFNFSGRPVFRALPSGSSPVLVFRRAAKPLASGLFPLDEHGGYLLVHGTMCIIAVWGLTGQSSFSRGMPTVTSPSCAMRFLDVRHDLGPGPPQPSTRSTEQALATCNTPILMPDQAKHLLLRPLVYLCISL